MSENAEFVPEVLSQTRVKIDTNGIVAVQAAKLERQILSTIKDEESNLPGIAKRLNEIQKELSKLYADGIMVKHKTNIQKLTAAVAVIDDKASVSLGEAKLGTVVKDGQHVEVVQAALTWGATSTVLTAPVSADIRKLLKERGSLSEKRTAIAARVSELRSDLNRMPQYERQLKAVVHENRLSQSAEGQAILKAMESGSAEAAKALGLPMPK